MPPLHKRRRIICNLDTHITTTCPWACPALTQALGTTLPSKACSDMPNCRRCTNAGGFLQPRYPPCAPKLALLCISTGPYRKGHNCHLPGTHEGLCGLTTHIVIPSLLCSASAQALQITTAASRDVTIISITNAYPYILGLPFDSSRYTGCRRASATSPPTSCSRTWHVLGLRTRPWQRASRR